MQNELTNETEEKVPETNEVAEEKVPDTNETEEKLPETNEVAEDRAIDNEEKEYVFYFDLYKLEGVDVFNAFKNAIDKQFGYKNIKYTLKQANTKQEDDVPKLMTGGSSNATFPYNIFENSIDNIRGVPDQERKSIFDGLFSRNTKSEETSIPTSDTSTPITSEVKETSGEPKKKGFFNFDFGIINIFKKSEKVDIKPTVTADIEEVDNEQDGEKEEHDKEEDDDDEGDDDEGDESEYDEEEDAEEEDEDVSQELIEGDEHKVNDIINENIITVELSIKCIDKKLCMPVILDIKKTMFMK